MAPATIFFRERPLSAQTIPREAPTVSKEALPDIAAYYSTLQIQTASNQKAVCMLHERCIHLLFKAQLPNADRKKNLIKAQNILAQLQSALILEDSVSQSLYYLYDYCYVRLEHESDEDISNARDIMNILNNTFQILYRQR